MSSDLSFAALGVPTRLDAVLSRAGIVTPTPIQAATLGDSLAGRDVLGRGRTGSGKTYAFLLPLVARLDQGAKARPKAPRGLILAPTRELVTQIEASLAPLAEVAGLRVRTVFGGVGAGPQISAMRSGVDIVIACPGRLEDLIGQGALSLSAVEITVLDEADHMADLGFLPGVKRLMDRTPTDGQRLLFSATLDRGVDVLVKRYLHDPARHEADSAEQPVAEMDHHLLQVPRSERVAVVADLTAAPGRTVVFTRTKRGAKTLTRQLISRGVGAVELHGNLSQNARERAMKSFHEGRVQTLVATDIAARGIHVDDVTLVVHADPPAEHKAYLHRSGRTARAGNRGTVVTVMSPDQAGEVRDLTRKAKISARTSVIAGAGDPVLAELAPGERTFRDPAEVAPAPVRQNENRPRRSGGTPKQGGQSQGGSGRRRRSGETAGQRPGSGGGQRRSGQRSSGGSSSGGQRSGGQRTGSSSGGQRSGSTGGAAAFSRSMRSR